MQEVTETATITWLRRVVSAHRSKAPPESATKTQVGSLMLLCCSCDKASLTNLTCEALQKNAQMTSEQLRDMMETSCLWVWLRPLLQRMLGAGSDFDKLQQSWEMGSLGIIVF